MSSFKKSCLWLMSPPPKFSVMSQPLSSDYTAVSKMLFGDCTAVCKMLFGDCTAVCKLLSSDWSIRIFFVYNNSSV